MANFLLYSSKTLYSECFLLLFFNILLEITIESQKFTKKSREALYTLHQGSPAVALDILLVHSQNQETDLVQSTTVTQISPVLHTLICVQLVLCNFLAGIDLHHLNQDTELFHHHKRTAWSCPLYSQLTTHTPLPPSLSPGNHKTVFHFHNLSF